MTHLSLTTMARRIGGVCRIAALAASVIAAQGAMAMSKSDDVSKDKPNVLILMFDDMRYDTFSYRNGPVSTPNIDQLASESTRFDYAMTTTGLCSPSRAAFFTGRWGHKTGLDDNIGLYHSRLSELNPEQGGLLRRAKDAGYMVGYVGKWHLGAQGVQMRGAEYVYGHEHNVQRHSRQWTPYQKINQLEHYNNGGFDENNEKHEYYETLKGGYEDTAAYSKVKAGKEMIKKAAQDDRPFFGVVSFSQPHPPYRVPEPYASMFDPEKLEVPPNHRAERIKKPLGQGGIWWPWHDVGHMSEMDWRKSRAYYYGAIAMIDRAVGEILQTAKDEGIYDDLHIVFLGDQGSMLGEHNLYDKGPYAYDELMRMPLLVKKPSAEPRIVNRQVSMLDVAPTLSEWMQLAPDGDVDGKSIDNLIEKGDAAVEGVDMAMYAYEWYNGAWFGLRAVRTPELKFVWNPGDSVDELYDLEKDPYELNNLINNKGYKPKLMTMLDMMEAELARVEDPSVVKFRHHKALYKSAKKAIAAH